MTKLSIIIVTYNAGTVLEKTLESVFRQTFKDYELLVIDGGSSDGTLQILERYASAIDFCESKPDNGIYDAMNKGLGIARGEYVQFLNAGDYLADEKSLEYIFRESANNPMLIYGDINMVDLDGTSTRNVALDFSRQNLLSFGTGVLCHQAMFVRRDVAPQYDTRYRFKGELNWYFDLVELEGFSYSRVNEIIVSYALGGWGYTHFISNRLDWLRLVYDRYGIRTVLDSRLLPYLWRNSFFRYPWLERVDRTIRMPARVARRLRRRLGRKSV